MTALDLPALYAECAPMVAPSTIAAIVQHESGGNPFLIHINGPDQLVRQPHDEAEAVATAQALMVQGYSFDVGLGQINNGNFARLGLTPDRVFDPCTNLQAAAQVLLDAYLTAAKRLPSGQALYAALSSYNTGSESAGFRNGYVASVVATARTQAHELPTTHR